MKTMYSLPSFNLYQNDAWLASILIFCFFKFLSSANECIHPLSGWWAFELFPGFCYGGQKSYKHSYHMSCCICECFSWVYPGEWNCWISSFVRDCHAVLQRSGINSHPTSSAWEVSGICTPGIFTRQNALQQPRRMNTGSKQQEIASATSEWARGAYVGRAPL